MNDLVSLSDDEREVLIVWNIDAMAHAHDRDVATRHWKRAHLLMAGRSSAQQARLDRVTHVKQAMVTA